MEERWRIFRSKIEEQVKKHAPVKTVWRKKGSQWINKRLKKLIRSKRKAWKTYKTLGTNSSWEKYNQLQRQTKKEIEDAKFCLKRKLLRE